MTTPTHRDALVVARTFIVLTSGYDKPPTYQSYKAIIAQIDAALSTPQETGWRDVVAALQSALVRTQINLDLAVRGRPVRDMAENLAENYAAIGLAEALPAPPEVEK